MDYNWPDELITLRSARGNEAFGHDEALELAATPAAVLDRPCHTQLFRAA